LIEEATILARQEGLRPALATEVIKTYKLSSRLNIPNLGNYVPEGWTRIDFLFQPVFVDLTSTSKTRKPYAITPFQFFARAGQHTKSESLFTVGYGIVEVGQTQVLVATYRKEV
jgi:hypothetical protein